MPRDAPRRERRPARAMLSRRVQIEPSFPVTGAECPGEDLREGGMVDKQEVELDRRLLPSSPSFTTSTHLSSLPLSSGTNNTVATIAMT